MDDELEVGERLARIERLDASGAPAGEVLREVRGLLHAAERLARRTADGDLAHAVGRVRDALSIGARGETAEVRRVPVGVDRVR